jgi:hypothetical protein
VITIEHANQAARRETFLSEPLLFLRLHLGRSVSDDRDSSSIAALLKRVAHMFTNPLVFVGGELFVTNTPNFAQSGQLNFLTPATFSQITATRDNPNDPREIQLSLKYYF